MSAAFACLSNGRDDYAENGDARISGRLVRWEAGHDFATDCSSYGLLAEAPDRFRRSGTQVESSGPLRVGGNVPSF